MLECVKSYMREHFWNIGFFETITEGSVEFKEDDIHWLKHDYAKEGWFADPFLLDANSEIIKVLVEDYVYSLQRGIISELIVDRKNYSLIKRIPLLKLDTHLSFPFIVYEDNKTYVCPENGMANNLSLYELKEDCQELAFVKTLIQSPLADATLFKDESGYYILTTSLPKPNGNTLLIYHSDYLMGEYSLSKEVLFPDNSARNAGAIFQVGNKYYKPSQDCNGGYGRGLKIYEMHKGFTFDNEYSFYLEDSKYDGIHTYNRKDNLAVVDFHAPRRPFLYKVLSILSRIKYAR